MQSVLPNMQAWLTRQDCYDPTRVVKCSNKMSVLSLLVGWKGVRSEKLISAVLRGFLCSPTGAVKLCKMLSQV